MASNPRQFKHPIPQRGQEAKQEVSIIPPEKIIEAAGEYNNISTVRWNGMSLAVRKTVGLAEMSMLVSLVLDRCWNDNMYLKEMMDFELRSAVITFYSNAALPEDDELRYKAVYNTDLYETVKTNIDEGQITAIEEAVKMYINQ